MNLSLDSMDILKIVLLIFEAVLLTDCVRGELLHFFKLFIFWGFSFHLYSSRSSLLTKLTGWFPVSLKKASVGF